MQFTPTSILCLQMMFAVLAAVGVYLLVPRGVGVGEVQLQSDHMSWNTTRGTYQLKLLAKIPIYNPNYMKVGQHSLTIVSLQSSQSPLLLVLSFCKRELVKACCATCCSLHLQPY